MWEKRLVFIDPKFRVVERCLNSWCRSHFNEVNSTLVTHLYGNSVPDVRHDVVVIVPTADRAVCVLVTWKLLVALNTQLMICLIHSRMCYLV